MPLGRPSRYLPHLTPADRRILAAWVADPTVAPALARRAALVLAVDGGTPIGQAAADVHLSRTHATKWLKRWAAGGLVALEGGKDWRKWVATFRRETRRP